MMRSARYSRSLGFTAHRCAPQPLPAMTSASKNVLEHNRQSTGELLCALGVVGIENEVVSKIEAERHSLLEGEHHAAAHVHGREVADRDGELVGLAARGHAAAAEREKRRHRRGRPEIDVAAGTVIED